MPMNAAPAVVLDQPRREARRKAVNWCHQVKASEAAICMNQAFTLWVRDRRRAAPCPHQAPEQVEGNEAGVNAAPRS
jgi:hypothetical protein